MSQETATLPSLGRETMQAYDPQELCDRRLRQMYAHKCRQAKAEATGNVATEPVASPQIRKYEYIYSYQYFQALNIDWNKSGASVHWPVQFTSSDHYVMSAVSANVGQLANLPSGTATGYALSGEILPAYFWGLTWPDPPQGSSVEYPSVTSICETQGGCEQVQAATDSVLFLQNLHSAVRGGNLQSALVLIFDYVGDLLSSGQVDACNRLLALIDTEKEDIDVLLTFLMATAAIRKKLPARKALYEGSRNRFNRELGTQETKKLLDTLA
jgi:hypothetical protein